MIPYTTSGIKGHPWVFSIHSFSLPVIALPHNTNGWSIGFLLSLDGRTPVHPHFMGHWWVSWCQEKIFRKGPHTLFEVQFEFWSDRSSQFEQKFWIKNRLSESGEQQGMMEMWQHVGVWKWIWRELHVVCTNVIIRKWAVPLWGIHGRETDNKKNMETSKEDSLINPQYRTWCKQIQVLGDTCK